MIRENLEKRADSLQEKISDLDAEAVLIQQQHNRQYFSGFTGSNGWLLVTPKARFIITDSRYFHQALLESPHFELVKADPVNGKNLLGSLEELLHQLEIKTSLGIESDTMTVKLYQSLKEKFKQMEFAPVDETLEEFRLYKEEDEIESISEAVRIAEEGFRLVEGRLKEGVTEAEFAAELVYQMKLRGAEKESFDVIVAGGENAAMPHAKASNRPFKKGELIVIDWGAINHDGYNSDMTRTFFMGNLDEKTAKIYNVVKEAQQLTVESIRPGMTCGQADAIARDYIDSKGYGEYFSHGLGHGVGLAVHEGPTLKRGSSTILKPGMVVTIEPGIYIPGKCGVRIEDMVVITRDSCRVLTSLPMQ